MMLEELNFDLLWLRACRHQLSFHSIALGRSNTIWGYYIISAALWWLARWATTHILEMAVK
jgi:hypothetical protein